MLKIKTPDVQDFEIRHTESLRAIAPECMVLLKKNGDFPLKKACSIALYGSGARETVKGGTGSGDVNVRNYITVEKGLERAGFEITTKTWLDDYKKEKNKCEKEFYDSILAQAKKEGKSAILLGMGKTPPEPKYQLPIDGEADVCIYVLSRNSGEGADRTVSKGDFLITEDEKRDILLCSETYKKFMLVLNVGAPVDISPVSEQVENILFLSQLGTVTGQAFSDVLLGKSYPSGKLTSTWATAEDYSYIKDFGQNDDTNYFEGIFVGYRYFDATKTNPLFPFGYGLGYTDFSIDVESFDVYGKTITVKANVKNTGSFPGKETVMLFYSSPEGALVKPLRELGAYKKTKELLPGECETVILELPIENMASWEEKNSLWILEKGRYTISLGSLPVGSIVIDKNVITERLSPSGGTASFADTVVPVEHLNYKSLSEITVDTALLEEAGHFISNKIEYDNLPVCDMSDFSIEELAEICVGKHTKAQGMAAMIGNSSARLAGGAGETADIVAEKGFGALVMADGPAGLRLATKYVETEKGQDSIDDAFSDIIRFLPEEIQKLIYAKIEKNKKLAETQTVLYHYACAIPIGTALAQSWNDELCELCGTIIGEEMEIFGANVWLAPALNIHRSPLCGRNFEYYSEDPLVSGRIAAAVTRGVQKNDKCAVTIKHFACNNQETNRYGSNSVVSQRALREIYLKAFEICVKESAPKSVMTSYNLLNGIHTANRRDLLTDILRNEWGFKGIVMTDWGTTDGKFNLGSYGKSSASQCIFAGNDLIMPGNTDDINNITDSVENGELKRADLEICAARILTISARLS